MRRVKKDAVAAGDSGPKLNNLDRLRGNQVGKIAESIYPAAYVGRGGFLRFN
jgi:hypothetical protein